MGNALQKRLLRVGLTGGIGSGKTTICHMLERYGVPIIDADVIGRRLLRYDLKMRDQLRTQLIKMSSKAVDRSGRIYRKKLRSEIFQNEKKRRAVEKIVHPVIFREMEKAFDKLYGHKYCIFCFPLLLETKTDKCVDKTVVVDVAPNIQIQRATKRDLYSAEHIIAIINSQMSQQERLKKADYVIQNGNGIQTLTKKVKNLHQVLETQAFQRKPLHRFGQ